MEKPLGRHSIAPSYGISLWYFDRTKQKSLTITKRILEKTIPKFECNLMRNAGSLGTSYRGN